MNKRRLTEADLYQILSDAGTAWRDSQIRPLTDEEKRRFRGVVLRARTHGQQSEPTITQQIASWLGIDTARLRSYGVLYAPWAGGLSPAQPHRGSPAAEGSMARAESAPSLDNLIRSRLEEDSFGNVTVSFQTLSKQLAGARVRYRLVGPSGGGPGVEGSVVLEPVDTGRWGGWDELGTSRQLGLTDEHILTYAVEPNE